MINARVGVVKNIKNVVYKNMIPKITEETLGAYTSNLLRAAQHVSLLDVYLKDFDYVMEKQPVLRKWYAEFVANTRKDYPNQYDIPLLMAVTMPLMLLQLQEAQDNYDKLYSDKDIDD